MHLFSTEKLKNYMKLDQAVGAIKACAEKMNAMYGRVIFNEWVLLSFGDGGAKMVAYSGPRKEHFQSNFAADVEELRPRLLTHQFTPGDFEFAWHGAGTGFEAFIAAGQRIYLLWNNTGNSMENLSKDPRWLSAQVPFLNLTEAFRADPLIL
jgi:hypothetical protein